MITAPAITGLEIGGVPYNAPMRIAKPLLLVTTPIGLAVGLYEGWRLAGGLVFIMAALIMVIGVAFGTVIWTIRKERAEEERKKAEASQPPASGAGR
ncbi:MAG TPA: hypothetical protein VGE08_12260 [Steroidobacter sp.]|uniref:hypothetical protein n=1 Tax=Steroidobacter sp. TaxID=1978227 RepID=UPI002ED8ECB4